MPSLYTETPSFIDYLQIKYKVSPTTKSIWKNTRKYKQRCIIQVKRFPNLNGNTIFEFHIHACNWFQRKQLVKDLNVQLSLKICIPRYIMAAIKGTKLLNQWLQKTYKRNPSGFKAVICDFKIFFLARGMNSFKFGPYDTKLCQFPDWNVP